MGRQSCEQSPLFRLQGLVPAAAERKGLRGSRRAGHPASGRGSRTGRAAAQPRSGGSLPPAQALTLLDALVVHLHVHHQRGAVAQHRHLRPVLLVAGAHPLGGLVSPPQLVAWREKAGTCSSFPHPLPPAPQERWLRTGLHAMSWKNPLVGKHPPRRLLGAATGSPCLGRAGERAL